MSPSNDQIANQNCSLWTARDEDTFLGVPLPRELCRCCMKAGSLLNSFMYVVFFYDIHQHFLRLRRSLVPTSHQSLCSFSPFPSRNRRWQPKVTGDSSTPSGGKSHHQYSRYLILWLVDTVTLLFVTLKPIPVPKRQMISLFQANGITFSGKWHHFFRVAIKIGFPGSGLYLIPTSTPLASMPDRIRYSPKVSANAKNQLHEKEEIWILANYHLWISLFYTESYLTLWLYHIGYCDCFSS